MNKSPLDTDKSLQRPSLHGAGLFSSFATVIHSVIRSSSKTAKVAFALLVAVLFCAPFLLLFQGLWSASGDVMRTVFTTVLAGYVLNTVLLSVCVAAACIAVGAGTAWITTQYAFPFRRVLQVLLPMSIVIAPYMRSVVYAEYADELSFTVVPFVREHAPALVPFVTQWFNFPFLVMAMTFSLYPYVYFFAFSAYEKSSRTVIDSARLLNARRRMLFFSVGLPLARTALIAGSAFVVIETINEYGAVTYFGFSTISSGVYRTWFSYGDIGSAQILSLVTLAIVLPIVWALHKKESRLQYEAQHYAPVSMRRLGFWKGCAAILCCAVPVAVGFVLPVAQFAYWASTLVGTGQGMPIADLLGLLKNTGLLVLVSAAIAVPLALTVSFLYYRKRTGAPGALAYGATALGYSVPGSVAAIAVLGFIYGLAALIAFLFGRGAADGVLQAFVSGGIAALIFAFIVRFLFVIAGPVYTGFAHYGRKYEQAARSLGAHPLKTLWRVMLPVNIPFIISGTLLFIVEILKEIPMTITLRPFNFDTLAIKTYVLANDEMVILSSVPMLVTVAIGLACMTALYICEQRIGSSRHVRRV